MSAVGLAISPSFGAKPDNFQSIAPLSMLIDPGSAIHRYKEAALTNLASISDTIGGLKDLSPSGFNVVESTAANEPELVAWGAEDAGVYYADSTDILSGNAASLAMGKNQPGFSVGLVFECPSALGTLMRLFNITSSSGNTRTAVILAAAGDISLTCRRVPGDTSHTFGEGSVRTAGQRNAVVVTINYATGALSITVNGVTTASAVTAGVGWGAFGNCENANSLSITLGCGSGGANPATDCTFRVLACYDSVALDASGISRLTALLNAAGGL